jgi:hypothetical protein
VPVSLPRSPWSARRSSSDGLTFLPSADHQMLHVMQPGEVPSAVVYFHERLFAFAAVVSHH